MALLKSLLTAAIVGRGIHAATLSLNGNECPNGWSLNAQNNGDDKSYCCFGSSVINGDDAYCCVRDTSSSFATGPDAGKVSVGGSPDDACFPFCDTTTQLHERAFPTPSCAEKIPFTASDYSSRVSAASKSAVAKATKTSGSEPNSATATATDVASTGSNGSGTGDSTESGGSATAASGSAKSTNAGVAATADNVLFVAAVAAMALPVL